MKPKEMLTETEMTEIDLKIVPPDRNETSGVYLELNSLIIEYKNLFDRSNKLDNKVYITITFCGFLFVFITGLFSGLMSVHPAGGFARVLYGACFAMCSAVVIAYVLVLLYFMRLLLPEGIIRMDPKVLREAHLDALAESTAVEKLIGLYREAIEKDLEKLKKRCDAFTKGLRYVILTVILAFAAYAMQVGLNLMV